MDLRTGSWLVLSLNVRYLIHIHYLLTLRQATLTLCQQAFRFCQELKDYEMKPLTAFN